MDGVSEDFSGLPEQRSRKERRAEREEERFSRHVENPYRGHRTRVILVGGFVVGLVLAAIALIIVFAPTPYLGVKHNTLAASIGGETTCRPAGSTWTCNQSADGQRAHYKVSVDWAGCWSGTLAGPRAARGKADPKISGCVSLLDHFRAG